MMVGTLWPEPDTPGGRDMGEWDRDQTVKRGKEQVAKSSGYQATFWSFRGYL